MLQIGKKIYFELNTGNVIMIRESRSGLPDSFVDTTKEQDFVNYTVLQPYQLSAVGEIQLEYGSQDETNLSKYPCHIDITKNPPVVVWDTANPLGATLFDVQSAKIAQINDLYTQKLSGGFSSSATGTAHIFGYGATDQMKFMQLAILIMNNMAVFPVNVPARDNTIVPHTQAQYQQLLIDIATFAQTQNARQHDYITQVNACTTIDQVNVIVVTF